MVGSIEKQGVLLITVLCHHFQYLINPVGHGSNILQVVGPGATSNWCVDNIWWQWKHCRIVTLFGSQVTCGVVSPKIQHRGWPWSRESSRVSMWKMSKSFGSILSGMIRVGG